MEYNIMSEDEFHNKISSDWRRDLLQMGTTLFYFCPFVNIVTYIFYSIFAKEAFSKDLGPVKRRTRLSKKVSIIE